jgi:hypothetical protein
MTKSEVLAGFAGLSMLIGAGSVLAQAPPPSSTGLTTPSQSVGLYVFPQKNQTADVQQQDEVACYGAAKTASGVDPAHPQPTTVQAAPAQQGGGVRGAARGAAGGAAIGAIAGDAGEGAAIGAAVGVVRGRQQQRAANDQAQAQAAQQAAASQQAQISSFKRAMTACLESKSYAVK